MTQYVEGVGLLPEDADQAMSTTALVAALMLTIPFSVMGRWVLFYGRVCVCACVCVCVSVSVSVSVSE